MGGRSRGKKPSRRMRQTSSLKDHRRTKKTLTPPLMSLPKPMMDIMWARDRLPDLLWICGMFAHHGEQDGLDVILSTFSVLERYLPEERFDSRGRSERPFFTGALTAFESVPGSKRQDAVADLLENGLYEDACPWLFARAMSKYENAPGAWLLSGWQEPGVPLVAADEPERFLCAVVTQAMDGHSRISTLTKAVVVAQYAKAGRLTLPASAIDELEVLTRYPFDVTEGEREVVESFLRATFSALIGSGNSSAESDPALVWARDFWRANWRLYPCRTANGPTEDPAGAPGDGDSGVDTREAARKFRDEFQAAVEETIEQFERVHRKADPDLYVPDRNEVLTGITARHVRAMDAMARYPALWADEQGTFVMRNLLEGRIVLRWLVHKRDPALFTKFKNYGRGRLKLQVLHLREYRDKVGRQGESLDDYLKYQEEVLNRDTWEEMLDISLNGNFAGVDTRRMATAVGMEDEYKLLFAPLSSKVHGEWASLDRQVMVPCENVLHRQHRIPNPDKGPVIRTDLAVAALDHFRRLVDDYRQAVAGDARPAT